MPTALRAALIMCLAAVTGTACTAEDPAAMVAARDSAGIRITEHPASALAALPQWRLGERPQVTIGQDEGLAGHDLSQVVGAYRLGSGTIVVGDFQTREIRFFSATGDLMGHVGGTGEGPGEFRRLQSLNLLPGDTLAVSDWPVGTLTLFDGEGGYLGNRTLGPFFPGLLGRVLPDGSLLMDVYEQRSYGNMIEYWAAYGRSGRYRPEGHIVRIHPGGQVTDTLRVMSGEEFLRTGTIRVDLVMRALPFTNRTTVAWSADRLHVTDMASRQVEVLGYDGALLQLIRWEGGPVQATEADRDRFREEVRASVRRPELEARFERWLSEVPFPEAMPPVRAMTTDRGGRLWVLDADGPGDGNGDSWIVFDRDGVAAARVELPAGSEILDLGGDFALLLRTDELGVETLSLHALER